MSKPFDGSPGAYYIVGADGRKRPISGGTTELNALVKAGVLASTTPVRMPSAEVDAIPGERAHLV